MEKKYFGTDGVRGYAGKTLTKEFAFKLGMSYGSLLIEKPAKNGKHKILIGMDTRESCLMFESALTQALSTYDFEIILLGVIPTPAVSFLTTNLEADGAIMISASHNPYHDNGIKFFSSDGTKISDSLEMSIESRLENIFPNTDQRIGSVRSMNNARQLYADFISSKFENKLVNQNKKIIIDCANGATYQTAELVFEKFGFDTHFIFNEPNGVNINNHCGSTHTENLQRMVLAENAHFGFAYDGDGDRLAVVDGSGKEINGDELLYLFARFLNDVGSLKTKKIAATMISNLGLENSLRKYDIAVTKTDVGDKYIMQALRDEQLDFGGESSGHIIFFKEHVTGDGILASMFFCWLVDFYGEDLNNIRKEFVKIPQVTKNLRIEDKYSWKQNSFFLEVIENIEKELIGVGRLLIRPSGTEPMVRIMVEHPNTYEAEKIVQQLASLLDKEYNKNKSNI